jgi:hypothetical protein
VAGFESSSSSCFSTTGDSVLCGVASGVASLLLDRPADAPPLPPPRADLATLGLGGIVTEVLMQGNRVVVLWMIHVAKVIWGLSIRHLVGDQLQVGNALSHGKRHFICTICCILLRQNTMHV